MAAWETYEEVAAFLLGKFAHEFGLKNVAGKHLIDGLHSGTKWAIDAKGIREGDSGFVIIECRRYTKSKLNQEQLAGLAYRIRESGAAGGILVSPLGMQKGAKKVAAAENIVEVHLNENSNAYEFVLSFLHRLMVGVADNISLDLRESVEVEIRDQDGNIARREP